MKIYFVFSYSFPRTQWPSAGMYDRAFLLLFISASPGKLCLLHKFCEVILGYLSNFFVFIALHTLQFLANIFMSKLRSENEILWKVYCGCVSQSVSHLILILLQHNLYPCKWQLKLLVLTVWNRTMPGKNNTRETPFRCGQKICGNIFKIWCSSAGPWGKGTKSAGFEPGRAIAPIPQWNLKCPIQKWLRGQFVP